MDILEIVQSYMNPQIYALAIAIYIVGIGLKKAHMINDRHIPLLLGGISMIFVALSVLSSNTITTFQEVCGAIVTIFVQGMICAAIAVYANQILRQLQKKGSVSISDIIDETEKEITDRDDSDQSGN